MWIRLGCMQEQDCAGAGPRSGAEQAHSHRQAAAAHHHGRPPEPAVQCPGELRFSSISIGGNRVDVLHKGAAIPNTLIHHMSPRSFLRRQVSSSCISSLKSCTALGCTFAENHHLESPCNTNASNGMGHLCLANYRMLDNQGGRRELSRMLLRKHSVQNSFRA